MSAAVEVEEKVAFKVILVGNAGVGKTNLLRVAMDEKDGYDEECEPTLNPDFAALSIPHPENANQQLQALVWDTAGQERYQAVTRSQYRRAKGALVVFDSSDPKSFAALPRWLDQLTESAGDTLTCVYIVENKVDLLPKGDIKSTQRSAGFADLAEVQKFCNGRGYKLFHTSAKMNSSVGQWSGSTAHEVSD
jgi:small GTP-binding protein